MPPRPTAPLPHVLLVAAVCAASLAANADFHAPPRFDGAGYAVLARSILSGTGYREIDHPDAPRHAHFPPGYPLALAAVWSVTGPTAPSAHAFSFACTLLAMILGWLWFRSWDEPTVALVLALALAVNWRWGRDGTAIQSEPLFLLLGQSAVLAAVWAARRGGWPRAVALGMLLGAAALTRHVGLAIAAAVAIDLMTRGRRREAVVSVIACALMIIPWIAWIAAVGHHTQVGLIPGRGLPATVAENLLFYARRLPDQIVGPVVEVATVFRPRYAIAATGCAALACGVIVAGWCRLIRDPDRRLAGLIPLFTMAMLLAWPFTEAGRFLVPLIPFLIAGAAEGASLLGLSLCRRPACLFFKKEQRQAGRLHHKKTGVWPVALVLAASIPYAAYAAVSGRAEAGRRTHRDFDAACAWIARHPEPAGPVLTRHPGEVFWLTGRTAIATSEGDSAEHVADLVARYRVAYLLIDDERYALAPKSPLGRFVLAFPGRVDRVYLGEGGRPAVVYRVRNPG